MELKRPNKALEKNIKSAVDKLRCPIHQRAADVRMDDEKSPVQVDACCVFFKNDVTILAERMRKEFIYKDQKTRERQERERVKSKYKNQREE
jgi:hypothetical protein